MLRSSKSRNSSSLLHEERLYAKVMAMFDLTVPSPHTHHPMTQLPLRDRVALR